MPNTETVPTARGFLTAAIGARAVDTMSMPNTVTVSTAKELLAAARVALPGGTILLAPGNYGDIYLDKIRPQGTVTIKTASGNNDAVFSFLTVRDSQNLVIQNVNVSYPLKPGQSDVAQAAWIGSSNNISFIGMHFSGSLDGNHFNDGNGLAIGTSTRIAILDSTFEQFKVGVKIGTSSDIIFAGNTIRDVREGVNVSRLDGALFEKNYVTGVVGDASRGDHPDAFQLHAAWTGQASKDIVFRSNVIVSNSQGIFIDSKNGAIHSNIVIENNYYEGNQRNAIQVISADNVVVRDNTLRGTAGKMSPAIILGNVSDVLVADNVAPRFVVRADMVSTNVKMSNNIDTWDVHGGRGASIESVFGTPLSTVGNIDFANLNVRGSSSVDVTGIGFRAVDGIGNLTGSNAAILASYVPQFDTHFSANFFA